MSDQECSVYEANANPANNTPNATPEWFIPPPSKDKYTRRSGNSIKLLDCGEDYLPAFYTAVRGAQKSIWIAIWGMDEELNLLLDGNRPENRISNILQQRADDGIEIKVMVWFSFVANYLGTDPTLRQGLFDLSQSWAQRAMAGEFRPKLQFLTRQSFDLHKTPAGEKKMAALIAERDGLQRLQTQMLGNYNYRRDRSKLTEVRKRIDELNAQEKRLKGAGTNADDVQLDRFKKGWPTITMGDFPTHHQKVILIDHRDSDAANGFVQGFNFWPQYFDYRAHPFRPEGGRIQDVGLHLRGPCLIDLFHNFKEGWNKALAEHGSRGGDPINESPPQIAPLTSGERYNAQILRTWPFTEENQIQKFILNAISKLNHFIYLEDQYFRMPEFVDGMIKRARIIKQRCGGQKKLHLFAVISLNKLAYGEADMRKFMASKLGWESVDNKEDDFAAIYEDQAALDDIRQTMEQNGIMAHICQLQASTHPAGGFNMNPYAKRIGVAYQNVYIHSKLSIYDDAYLLLGSANWNVRSMNQDSELDIALQSHDSKAKAFREKLWREHLHGKLILDQFKTPKEWYKKWDELLHKNWVLYRSGQPLMMNLFPYFEDITSLTKQRWPLDIPVLKQSST